MSENGVKTNTLISVAMIDEVLGNRDGTTVVTTIPTLSQQLLGSGPLADAIASNLVTTGADVVAAQAARDEAEQSAGVVSQATSVASLDDPTTLTAGDGGLVIGSGDDAIDGYYEVRANSPNEWVRIRATGLAGVQPQIDSVKRSVSDVSASLSEILQVVGLEVSELTSSASSVSSGTYTFLRPLVDAGDGVRFFCFANGPGAVHVHIASRTSPTNSIVREQKFDLKVGLNEVTLFDLPHEAGDILGFRVGGGVIAIATGGDGNTDGYWSTSGQIAAGQTYDDAASAAAIFKVRFETLKQAVTAAGFDALSVSASRIGTPDQPTEIIGRPVDPVAGTTTIQTSTYVIDDATDYPRRLTSFKAQVTTPGDMFLGSYSKAGDVFTPVDVVSVALTRTGLVEISAPPELVLEPGELFALQRGTAVIALNTGVGDFAYYSGAGQMVEFTDDTSTTVARFEFQAAFEAYTHEARLQEIEAPTNRIKPDGFIAAFLVGESHGYGPEGTALSRIEIPAGAGYKYIRSTSSLEHMQDPTSAGGAGGGSVGPALCDAILRRTDGAIGTVLVNSAVGGTKIVENWNDLTGSSWTQAAADWADAVAQMNAQNIPIVGVSVYLMIGSNDAAASTSAATFKAGVLTLKGLLDELMGFDVALVLAETGRFVDGAFSAEVAAIRNAQRELVNENASIFMGWANAFHLTDAEYKDNVHYTTQGYDAAGRGAATALLAHGVGKLPSGL